MPSLAEIISADVVDNYADREAQKAFEELRKLHDGQGCRCKNCILMAVNKWNQWVDYYIEDEDSRELYHAQAYLDKNGQLKVAMGFALEGK